MIVCYRHSDPRSIIIAEAFHEGIKTFGDKVEIIKVVNYPPARPPGDIAVFYGFDDQRKKIFNEYLDHGRKVVFVDLGYFGRDFGGRYHGYHRISVNSRHPDVKVKCPPDRWTQLQNLSLLENLETRESDKGFILLIGMSAKSAQSYGLGHLEWERSAVVEIRKHTDRPIIYRPKIYPTGLIKPIEGATLVKDGNTLDLLRNAHCAVMHHSNCQVECIAIGTPFITIEGAAKAFSNEFSEIENTKQPDEETRRQFLSNIAYFQYTPTEIRQGLPWRFLRENNLI